MLLVVFVLLILLWMNKYNLNHVKTLNTTQLNDLLASTNTSLHEGK